MAYASNMANKQTLAVPKHTSAAIANESELGPAMRALNERQRAFVDAMFVLGAGATYADAARSAGYSGDSENALRVQAHRLAHSDRVQAAMREEAERRCAGLLPTAHAGMAAIIGNPAHQDHFKAIKHAQALAGLAPTQKHEVIHKTDTASLKADLLAALAAMQATGPMIDVTPAIENHSQDEEDWVAI